MKPTGARVTGGARIVAGASLGCAFAFFGIALAFTFIWRKGYYFYVYLGYGWLCIVVIFTMLYIILRPRASPSIGWNKAVVHILLFNFLVIPIAVITWLGTTYILTMPIEMALLLLIQGLLYKWSFRFPPGLRKERDLDNLAKNRAAFLFPLLCWPTPALLVTLELAIFGYWIARNRGKVTRRTRTVGAAVLLVAGLALSPLLIDSFLVHRDFRVDITYDLPAGVPAGIVSVTESFNVSSFYNDFYYHFYESLGRMKDALIQHTMDHDPFTYHYGVCDVGSYMFSADAISSGVNYTYSQIQTGACHGRIVALNGSVLLDLNATIYINASMTLPATAVPHTETFAGSVVLVSVQISREMVCGSLCGNFWAETWWFLVTQEGSIISVLYILLYDAIA